MPDLSHLAEPGTEIAVRVTPKASRARIELADDGTVKVWVTVSPEGGKANDAVIRQLAKALGVPKTALTLVRGAASRDKVVRLDHSTWRRR
ncbi:DUF167 domain-containing protein [Pelagovum pacificum]|uniref:UPF0235 protein FHY64_10160 n=1 Tax=Pelagovum pacificum TaxID=2588711 RepID=A0A5C5GKV7_9RHOB|nr:DUF167 domain-containing protein [Pelagovum pacificum]QQA44879.1 DUF167 domain-containing protein [Pelagovum pacificum]TNY34369.1 DUF167 domain-containing protein [Pelagovum pacificum]